ncbi:hypothetical protein [Marinifilum sp. D714]|uniref:hypothetical protein n=1 Tax=Marinifilum sp. D714 TaxID=2937523 RepID=UPI0027CFC138|nr:hypothetical protein [Marinifilum sp. D714]MDQ2179491.1 hypothetical protein [Marinifilum sp. D714]
MKKLLHSLLICLGILMMSSQIFAQNAPGEKLQPYKGGTYTYTFKGINDNLDYEFYISTSNSGIGAKHAALTGHITSSLTGKVAGNKAMATITWPSSLSLPTGVTEVFLFVKISGTGVCENYKAVGITPIDNNMTLALALGDGETSPTCPDLTGFNAIVAPTDTYNPGTTELTFKFEKGGSTNNWDLEFDIVQTGIGDYSYTIGGTTTNVTDDAATTPVSKTNLSGNTQILTIVVKNVPGEATPSFRIVPKSAKDAVTKVTVTTMPSAVNYQITTMPEIGDFE